MNLSSFALLSVSFYSKGDHNDLTTQEFPEHFHYHHPNVLFCLWKPDFVTPDEVSHQKASVNSMYSSLSLFEIVATGDNLWLLIRSAADSYILSSTAHVSCLSHLLEIFHAFFSLLFFHFKSMLAVQRTWGWACLLMWKQKTWAAVQRCCTFTVD